MPESGGGGSGLLGLLGGGALSFLPSILSGLFGGKSSDQRLREQMLKVLSPYNFSKLAGQYYQNNIGGAAFSQGQRDIAGGANQASNQLAQSLGARGIGTTGTAALMSSLTPSLVGSQMGQLRQGAWNSAQGQAQNNIQQQLQALQGTSGPSQTSQMFAGGMSAFAPYLQSFLGHHYPGVFGNMQGGQQNQQQPQSALFQPRTYQPPRSYQ